MILILSADHFYELFGRASLILRICLLISDFSKTFITDLVEILRILWA